MYKGFFSRFLDAAPERLHFAAHSHHLWPDVSFDAQMRCWLDAADRVDGKWEHVLGTVLPRAQRHVAHVLGLSDAATVALAPNTHELVLRLLSCLEGTDPVRILTTDGEFHSFERQSRRLEEAGRAEVERVAVEPFASFGERFREAVEAGGYDLLYFSQVLYNSGFVVPGMAELVAAVPSRDAFVAIDGYHGFMALPTDLSAVEGRAFYLAGGYKYAMSGEGVCFMHCPPGYGPRPVNTGWFATFGELERGVGEGEVAYGGDGFRFFGSTFDPSGLYRFNAVMDLLLEELGLTVADIHGHARHLQGLFLAGLAALALPDLDSGSLIPDPSFPERGNFLTFRLARAGEIHRALWDHRVITDHRGDRLRFGFGLYQDEEDVKALCLRLKRVLG